MVVNKVRPSVVEITTSTGLGSGVVYDDNGDIATNDHVVRTARNFQVSVFDGRVAVASLAGVFPPYDLAVIRVHAVTRLHPAVFANSSQLQVGHIDLAIGNPLGLASSVTEGIVSFTRRTVGEGNGVVLPGTIQTSGAINPGNSGGALVDTQGRVIGIPTFPPPNPNSAARPPTASALPFRRTLSSWCPAADHGRTSSPERPGRSSAAPPP